MKLKSDHFLYAAGACLGAGLALYWLSDVVAAEEERRKSRYGRIRRNHARNAEHPQDQERGA